MNQPVEGRFKQIEERLAKVEQQQTEPIKVTVERRQTEVERVLDNHTELLRELSTEQKSQSELLQIIFNQSGTQNTDIAVLKHEMQGARADIIAIKATQSDHGELLKNTATKEDLSILEARIDDKMAAMESRLIDAMKMLFQQRPSE